MFYFLAEGAGFEPAAPYEVTGFQDQLLKPLGHPSVLDVRCRNIGRPDIYKEAIYFSSKILAL